MDDRIYIEKYLFHRLSYNDILQAIQSLSVLKRYKKRDVRFALLRDFVVSYARPFVGSKGFVCNNHKLNESLVPKDSKELHKDIIHIRHKLFAHNDLNFRDPKVVNWSEAGILSFPMSFKGSGYEKLDDHHPDMLKLAEVVLNNIRKEIAKREPRLASILGEDAKPLYFT